MVFRVNISSVSFDISVLTETILSIWFNSDSIQNQYQSGSKAAHGENVSISCVDAEVVLSLNRSTKRSLNENIIPLSIVNPADNFSKRVDNA